MTNPSPVYAIDDLRAGYQALCEDVVTHGAVVSPRGEQTFELLDAVLYFPDAHGCTFPAGIGRSASRKVLAAEMLQWLGGFSDLRQLESVSSVFSKFSDDGVKLYGAYGPRTFSGMRRAVDLLSADEYTRQATVSIWRHDEAVSTLDLPCTVAWSFNIRDDKLNMTTYMRSNDLWTGVSYDIPAMARIQSAMAWALKVELGSYTHHAQSFHFYERDLPGLEKLHDPDDVEEPPFFDKLDERYVRDDLPAQQRWRQITGSASSAYRGAGMTGAFEYYADLLRETERNEHFCLYCRYVLPELCKECR